MQPPQVIAEGIATHRITPHEGVEALLTVHWRQMSNGALTGMPVAVSVSGPLTPEALPMLPTANPRMMEEALRECLEALAKQMQQQAVENASKLTIAGPDALKGLRPPHGRN